MFEYYAAFPKFFQAGFQINYQKASFQRNLVKQTERAATLVLLGNPAESCRLSQSRPSPLFNSSESVREFNQIRQKDTIFWFKRYSDFIQKIQCFRGKRYSLLDQKIQ